jgi:hypothetical protein
MTVTTHDSDSKTHRDKIMDIRKRNNGQKWQRLIAMIMAPLIMAASMPLAVVAQVARTPQPPRPPVVANTSSKPVKVKTGPHKLNKVTAKMTFSDHPSDLEITRARIFSEPLTPMSGKPKAGENEALASALIAFKKQSDPDNISDLTKFMAAFPHSRWCPSLYLNLGHRRFDTGYLTEAMSYWSDAWQSAKEESGASQKRVADSAVAELLELKARLGKADEIEKLLAQVGKRHFMGSDEEKVHCAIEGLGRMKRFPEKSFKCGPYAIDSILNIGKTVPAPDPVIDNAKSTDKGTSLFQVKQLADKVGLHLQMARRSPGASPVVPSVVHWNLNHFGAIVGSKDGRYIIKDPTFGVNPAMSVSAKALDAETDGYALVPAGVLPGGWHAVSEQEAQKVWGGGAVSGTGYGPHVNPPPTPCFDQKLCPSGKCSGMAHANAWMMQAILNINDTPLSYTPSVGPPIDISINNNYLQADQPATFSFSNLGPNWRFNFLSYLTVDPVTSDATVRTRSGDSEYYAYSSGYTNDLNSQALLVNMGGGTYQRQMKDGSIEVFNLSIQAHRQIYL